MVMVAVSGSLGQENASGVLDRIVENWRWSRYWFGSSGIDDVYAEGKKISALVFWNTNNVQPMRGLCSSEFLLCVAYSGVYFDPLERRIEIAPNVPLQRAFTSFVNRGFGDSSHIIAFGHLRLEDFRFEEISVTLPHLGPPSSVLVRTVPEEAPREAERVRRLFNCWGAEPETRPPGCTGRLAFAFYGMADPYWFVLRTCSTKCAFRGDSVEELARGERGWEARAAGFINSPKAEVERLRRQIEKAEMFRLEF
jgi:hypothetical protein